MMSNFLRFLLIICLSTCFIACDDDEPTVSSSPNTPNPPTSSDWLIPVSEVFDGGPGKDGIPSIDNPQFTNIAGGDQFLTAGDLVVGIAYNGVARAYPHEILDWHEIVNDNVGGLSVAVTYCPLTGTASGWNRVLQGGTAAGQETTFGVSGLLYNTNLIPYDRNTDSNWSQLLMQSVQGSLQGESIKIEMVVETTWETWKKLYPQTQVLSRETGFSRSYGLYPYGDYRTNDSRLLFPISKNDNRIPAKERVHGIAAEDNASAIVFDFSNFPGPLAVKQRSFNGKELVVVGSSFIDLIVSYYNELEGGADLIFDPAAEDQFPILMTDSQGNAWDVFGEAVSGPRTGQRLTPTRSCMGYFFSFGTFFPGVEINDE
ncbi:MAG: DUF3179 domain-containing protein [Bacteroidota bacterium]